MSEKLSYFLEENREIAKKLIEKSISAEAREAAKKAREEAGLAKKENEMRQF